MIDLTEKYKPLLVSELEGRKSMVDAILSFLDSGKKALLIHGKSGIGKTFFVELCSKEKNYELVRVDASDRRDKGSIESIIGNTSKYGSLFGMKKLILIDELDGISGTQDRGGITELVSIVKETSYPIILITNDIRDSKISTLKKYCEILNFDRMHFQTIVSMLKKIALNEGLNVDEQIFRVIAKKSEGDVRSAILDLQVICAGKNQVSQNELENLGYREKKKDVFEALEKVIKNRDLNEAVHAFDNVDMEPGTAFLWVSENLPIAYDIPEIAKAYEFLSRADVFRGRIHKKQFWRFLYYQSLFSTAGVCISKDSEKHGWIKYQMPSKIMKLWSTKSRRHKIKEICLKLGKEFHCSSKIAEHSYLSLIQIMIKKKNEVSFLNDEEKEFLKTIKLLN